MRLDELKRLDGEEIIEVNGIELSFMVSMISNRSFEKDQETCLLESYYEFLNQSKNNGFVTQYIKMSVTKALRIFKNFNELDPKCIRPICNAGEPAEL